MSTREEEQTTDTAAVAVARPPPGSEGDGAESKDHGPYRDNDERRDTGDVFLTQDLEMGEYFEPAWIRKLPTVLYDYLHPKQCCCGCWTLKTSAYVILVLYVLGSFLSFVTGVGGGISIATGNEQIGKGSADTGTSGKIDSNQRNDSMRAAGVFSTVFAAIVATFTLIGSIYLIAGFNKAGPEQPPNLYVNKLRRGVSILIGTRLVRDVIELLILFGALVMGKLNVVLFMTTIIFFFLGRLIAYHFLGVILSYCLSIWLAWVTGNNNSSSGIQRDHALP